jgi:hypothetical protein
MTIEKYESNGIVRLRLVRTYRIKDTNGKSVNRKEVIKSLGALSNYDDGEPDYLDRLRKSFAAKQPIIPELLPYVDYAPKEKITISFTTGDKYCAEHRKFLRRAFSIRPLLLLDWMNSLPALSTLPGFSTISRELSAF